MLYLGVKKGLVYFILLTKAQEINKEITNLELVRDLRHPDSRCWNASHYCSLHLPLFSLIFSTQLHYFLALHTNPAASTNLPYINGSVYRAWWAE